MGEGVGCVQKHSQSKLSTPSIQKSVFSYSASQTSYSIKLTITSASYIIDKEQNNCIFCSQINISNDLNVTNNDNVQSCETPRKLKHHNHFNSKTSCATYWCHVSAFL